MPKRPAYVIRTTPESVTVQHRLPPEAWLLVPFVLAVALVIGYLGGESPGALGLVASAATIFAIVRIFRTPSAELFRCDRTHLLTARRTIMGRWTRITYPLSEVHQLRRQLRTQGRSSTAYLTFTDAGRDLDMFPDITVTQCEDVLHACREFGVDTTPPDPAAAMLKDIEKRGWWQNPYGHDR